MYPTSPAIRWNRARNCRSSSVSSSCGVGFGGCKNQMRLCKGQRVTHRREARHVLSHINSGKEEPHTGHYRLALKEKPAELSPSTWEVLSSIPSQQKERTGSAQHRTCWPASSCSREFHMGLEKRAFSVTWPELPCGFIRHLLISQS